MSESQASVPATSNRPFFYIGQNDPQRQRGIDASIWPKGADREGAHQFSGNINGDPVFGYVNTNSRGKYITFKRSKDRDEATGKTPTFAFGSIVCNKQGYPALVINIQDEAKSSVWCNVSRDMPQDQIDELGFAASKARNGKQGGSENSQAAAAAPAPAAAPKNVAQKPAPTQNFDDMDDDIPF